MTPLVYIIGFVAILFTAMSYMRMSKRFPIAGSVYSYVQRGINPHVGFMAGWLILLDYVLVPSLLIVMVMNWGVALVPGSPAWLWAVAFIAFNTFVNIRGIQMSRGVDWVIFIVEIGRGRVHRSWHHFVLGGGGAGGFVLDPIYQPGQVDALRGGGHLHRGAFVPGLRRHVHAGRGTHEPERTSARASSSHCPSSSSCSWRRPTSPPSCSRLGGHRSRHGLLRFRLPGGRAGVLQDHVAGQHRRGGHRQHHQRADGILRLLYSMGRDGVIPRVFGKVHPSSRRRGSPPSSWARSRCAWRFRCRTTWARWRAS
ncbi:MAG: APC family permease [Eggerthellaceae bacterium]